LEFNVAFQQEYGYIRDERSGAEGYPYPIKEGQQYINFDLGRLFIQQLVPATQKGKGIERLI